MHRRILAIWSLLLLASCGDNSVYHTYKNLPPTWQRDSAVVFKVGELDSLTTYNAFVTVRNDNDYGYSNLFLITEMQSPNGKTVSDTLEYIMANPDGSWLGTGFGSVKENKLWYKENVRFDEQGTYTFSIRQAMRANGDVNGISELEGIRDVGLRIEKNKE